VVNLLRFAIAAGGQERPPFYLMKRIAFFAHERGDARVVKRISALRDEGWGVLGFTFHRDRGKPEVPPAWEDIDLGTTYNRRYVQRLFTLGKSLVTLWRERDRLGDCAVIYAVNTDNAALALCGRFLSGSRAPLVLELADIQPAMTGAGVASRLMRSVERWVLRRSALLVTTSPGFVRHYFGPVQGFKGEIFLLENKIYPSTEVPVVEMKEHPVRGGAPWVVGYSGAFRCRRSMELIGALAERLRGKVHFVLRGYASGTITEDFTELLGERPEVVFGGPYAYPDDLPGMYGAVDFNWCFDESDPGGNSAWLLPNRIYEGGLFRTPALAAAGTETGRWVAENGCGWEIPEPLEESLAEFFKTMTEEKWRAAAARCAAVPDDLLRGEGDYVRLGRRLGEMVSGC
jgi:succinoglycan biosynthesis protein ExoL